MKNREKYEPDARPKPEALGVFSPSKPGGENKGSRNTSSGRERTGKKGSEKGKLGGRPKVGRSKVALRRSRGGWSVLHGEEEYTIAERESDTKALEKSAKGYRS